MNDMVAGQIDLMVDAAVNALPLLRAGLIKAYAVTAKTRMDTAPDIPTADEAGAPGLHISIWNGIWMPRGTPKDAIAKLNAASVDAMADPIGRKRLADLGLEFPPRDQQTGGRSSRRRASRRNEPATSTSSSPLKGHAMKIQRREFLHLGVINVALPIVSRVAKAQAQDWPTRPLTMVVPYAAGGPIDIVGRILASHLSERLGQQVIIENVGGAGGMTGSCRVARSVPDGYQFVLGNVGTHAANQSLYKSPLYNAATDFAPVLLIAETPLVLLARKDFPANNLPEFIDYAKSNQAKMRYGSGGAGFASHLACELLDAAIGVNVTHIPYRGAAPAMQDFDCQSDRLPVP